MSWLKTAAFCGAIQAGNVSNVWVTINHFLWYYPGWKENNVLEKKQLLFVALSRPDMQRRHGEIQTLSVVLSRPERKQCPGKKEPFFVALSQLNMQWWPGEKQPLFVALSQQDREKYPGQKNHRFSLHYCGRIYSDGMVKNNHFLWHCHGLKESNVPVQLLFVALSWLETQQCLLTKPPLFLALFWLEMQRCAGTVPVQKRTMSQ